MGSKLLTVRSQSVHFVIQFVQLLLVLHFQSVHFLHHLGQPLPRILIVVVRIVSKGYNLILVIFLQILEYVVKFRFQLEFELRSQRLLQPVLVFAHF